MPHDYKAHFPFPDIRPEQHAAIEFALDAFLDKGKRFVILQMGTGCGKSAMAVAVAQYLASRLDKVVGMDGEEHTGAYVLTTQKILQEQYMNDFGAPRKNLMVTIKSSANYQCQFYKDQSCAESRRVISRLRKQLQGTDFLKTCQGNCCYSLDKQKFIESPLGVTNFSYFLAETMYAKKLGPRALLIIDECHNTENELGRFIEVTFSERFARDILKCKVPGLKDQEAVFNWIRTSYKSKLAKHIKELEKAIESKLDSESEGLHELTKQYEMLDKHICKVNRFITAYDASNWIMNTIRPNDGDRRRARKFEFKSIDVSKYSHDMLFQFGCRVLMMSATVIDKNIFCKSVGIDPTEAEFLSIPSPFPIENRLVHYVPAGSMSMKNIDTTLPVMVEVVKLLISQHPNEKGIIHAVNYKVAQYLHDHIKDERLLIHTTNTRDVVMQMHLTSKEPTILLSPSMMEGVDLADDASRFQILCKVPFPYLGDDLIRKRMERNKEWYTYQTVKSVIQAFGRSIRNETDHAISYIIDEDWGRFYQMNKKMFPEEFSNALT